MVSCSGFGLPLHAQLLRLFVTRQLMVSDSHASGASFAALVDVISSLDCSRYNRQGRKANVGAGTATATEPTREHKQYATQGPTTYLCT